MLLPKVELLPKELLVKTSDVDHADWNYRPLLGLLQRVRFKLIASLLPERANASFLEIGYGSGVFFPHLVKYCERLAGIDIHSLHEEVASAVRKTGIDAELVCGDVVDMPFEDGAFDCAVAVSSLEYVQSIDQACQEIERVLKPTGKLVVVTPGQSPILDAGLRLFGGEDAQENYGDRRSALVSTLEAHFDVETIRKWPALLPGFTVYRALRLRRRG